MAGMIPTLLGGLSADEFLSTYWQKKPLLIRGAVPGFTGVPGLAGRDDALAFAARDDAECRLVSRGRNGESWQLDHGPFNPRALKRRPGPWTILLQGVNLAVEGGDRLLREFDFIPYARLDDLMVSYATGGGGVGPHIDSYDVFLLQGIGCRRWRIGRQRDRSIVDGLPVRILADFRPQQEWLLEPGDMLYLPPDWAHDGVAEGECMTWSIGFRAFPAQELAEQFLMFLQDRICLGGRYRDPDLRSPRHPAQIDPAMIEQIEKLLSGIRWNRATVRDFLGSMLTEPKAQVFFEAPRAPAGLARFSAQAAQRGIRLDARTQLFFSGTRFFINGESVTAPRGDQERLRQLADRRTIDSTREWSPAGLALLHEWHLCGYLSIR